MGTNRNPGVESGIIIRGYPEKHEESIQRQGSLIRLLHASKCPCIKNGSPQLHCKLCKGKGYRFSLQEEIEVLEENSPHGFKDMKKIYPFNIPISRVAKVQRWLFSNQGGNHFYNIVSNDDTSITIQDDGKLPQRFETIRVTYHYKNYETIINENSIHNGTYLLETINTEISTEGNTSNPFDIFGDIMRVNRIFNVTKNISYDAINFTKKFIYIDPKLNNRGEATVNPPETTDILQVDYDYVKPMKALVTNVEVNNAVMKYFEDVKQGDVTITIPGAYHIGRGDIITSLSTILKDGVTITRGADSFDELPCFDVKEIIGFIEDEDGVIYKSDSFYLSEYNNLNWIQGHSPAQGKKYTVNYLYRPSYMVYRQQTKTINAGDRRYPQKTFARFLNRFSIKDFEKVVQS